MLHSQKLKRIEYNRYNLSVNLKNYSKLLDSYSIELKAFLKKLIQWSLFNSDSCILYFQQMLAIAIFIILQISKTGAQESFQAVFEIVNKSILFDETPFSERTSGSLTSCSLQCTRDKRCKSANFIKSEEMCSLIDKTRRTHPLLFQKQDNVIHLQKVWQIIIIRE